MRGTTRSLSPRRRLIADMMHASRNVPLITLRRTFALGPLLAARRAATHPPGFAAIFVKAFALVARDEPALRTLYLAWPWPRLYELPHSSAIVAIARRDDAEPYVMFEKINHASEFTLALIDDTLRRAKAARDADVPHFARLLRVSRLPLLLRRLIWGFALNSGRIRSNQGGTFGVTAVSGLGRNELHALSPGPFILSYGRAGDDGTMDVVIRWDHRVADGALIAEALERLEAVLNGAISQEIGRDGAGSAALRGVDSPAHAP
jgi:hypothetical protein